MRIKGGTVGLAMLALLVGAPAAMASTASLRSGTTVVYAGDPGADTVTLSRYVDNRGTSTPGDDIGYYIYSDGGGITSGVGCIQIAGTMSACRVSAGLKRYEISTRGGNDRVTIYGETSGGTSDLGTGADRFTGLGSGSAADATAATASTPSTAARATTRSPAAPATTRSAAASATTASTAAATTTP